MKGERCRRIGAAHTTHCYWVHGIAAKMPIDVLVSNHSEWDDSIAKINA